MSFISESASTMYLPPEGTSVLPEADDLSTPTDDDGAAYYGKEPAFDFDTGEFITDDDGNITYVEGPDAVLQSLQKALSTKMGEFLAYPDDYGNELVAAFAEAPVGATVTDLALSYCADCIEADPRVSSVDGLDVVVDEGAETVDVTGLVVDSFGSVIELELTFSYATA